MCLILLSYQQHRDYPLIVLGNRDEFFSRATETAHYWPEHPHVFAGRDGEAGGTWMGITQKGRFAAVTNYREPAQHKGKALLSRGELTTKFLAGDQPPAQYLAHLQSRQSYYAGFNLLAGDTQQLFYYSNRSNHIQKLVPGLYGLSNSLLNSAWPKVIQGKQALAEQLKKPLDIQALLTILMDRNRPEDEQLPDTGVGIETERLLSSRFISSSNYGTRCASVLLVKNNNSFEFIEQNFHADGTQAKCVTHNYNANN